MYYVLYNVITLLAEQLKVLKLELGLHLQALQVEP